MHKQSQNWSGVQETLGKTLGRTLGKTLGRTLGRTLGKTLGRTVNTRTLSNYIISRAKSPFRWQII